MFEKEIKKLAWILVNHSTKVKKGETVQIFGYAQAKPILNEIYKEVLRKGAFPRLKVAFEEFSRDFYELACEEHLKSLSEIDMFEIRHTDVVISVGGNLNTFFLAGIDSKKYSMHQKTYKPYQDWRIDKTRWVGTRFPTTGLALNSKMSLQDYMKFYFNSTNKDWESEGKKQDNIKGLFDKAKKVRVRTKDTDITIDINSRPGTKCFGQHNMPDGEVFYSPNEKLTEGYISFTYPGIYNGVEVDNVRLEFKDGKVVRYSCSSNKKMMKDLLETDEGAKYLGELGIGTNMKIQNFTRDVLLDEKIGGSVHLALGRAYKENGGTNESAIHWDMIKDLRKQHGGGEIILDGKCVQRDGKWIGK